MRPLLTTLLLTACSIPTPWQEQRNYAQSLKPAEVKPTEATAQAAVRTFKVRAWADGDYQALQPRWSQSIVEQIGRASDVLTAQFGVRLDVVAVKPWHRDGSSATLIDPLEQLMSLDPGDDVDWVVGFVSSLDVFSAAQDQLGMAPFFGHHFVLRGMSSAAEQDAINRALNLLSEKERIGLARERRQHKETAVLLHEWAHTMGTFHERSPEFLMSPAYDTSQSSFSPESARIVAVGLELRKTREAWGKAYLAELEKSLPLAWDAETREQTRVLAERYFGGDAAPDLLARDDLERFKQAYALRDSDRPRARTLLAPLVEKYPHSASVQGAACLVEPESSQIPNSCKRAAAMPGATTEMMLYVARRLVAMDARAEAIPLLVRSEHQAKTQDEWASLARIDLDAGFWSGAERAASHAPAAAGVGAEAGRMKSFVGFPEKPLPPAREAEYVKAALAAHDEIDQHRYERAMARGKEISLAFQGTPAAVVIECRARSRGRALELTRSACATAAEKAPSAFYPQYILGLVASSESRWSDAGTAMRRAIEIDGGTPQVWASLAAVELKLGRKKEARELSTRYEKRFREPLHPALWPAGWTAR